MIPTTEGVYVDACDPLYPALAGFPTWLAVKRLAGRNLTRTDCGTYLLIASEDEYPDYPEIRTDIARACRIVIYENP